MNPIEYIKLLRIKQWTKNLFIFLPLFFAGDFFDPEKLNKAIISFIIFSIVASAIYCINDIYDVKNDKTHPEKSKRPIANGSIKIKHAWALSSILLISSSILIFFADFGTGFSGVILFYIIQNILYTYFFKKVVILDVFVISIGFVLRLFAGSESYDVTLSPWIVIITFLLALYLSINKRRGEYVLYKNSNIESRKNITNYNYAILNAFLIISSSIVIVAYIMYTILGTSTSSFNSDLLYFTSIFVIFGIFRILYISLRDEHDTDPTSILFKDSPTLINLILWITIFYILLYL